MEFNQRVALVTGGGQGLGKVIAQELAARGCQVVISSRRQNVLIVANLLKHQVRSKHALPRPAKPTEVAALVVFLASEMASYINGSNIRVDGGSIATL